MGTRESRIEWMLAWAAHNACTLQLEGECGLGRECVGITKDGNYPDYHWYNESYERIDPNGEIPIPTDAYHKHPCLAVLGRGEEAERQLFHWLHWFDQSGFTVTVEPTGPNPHIPTALALVLGKNVNVRMQKPPEAKADGA